VTCQEYSEVLKAHTKFISGSSTDKLMVRIKRSLSPSDVLRICFRSVVTLFMKEDCIIFLRVQKRGRRKKGKLVIEEAERRSDNAILGAPRNKESYGSPFLESC
jgi:hypothetical protein